MATFVFLAGINNSGPEHWQRHFMAKLPGSVWVEHSDWDAPEAEAWVAEMDQTVAETAGALVLVAHSLGCLLALEWLAAHAGAEAGRVKGLFMVAPPDPQSPAYPAHLAKGFEPGYATPAPSPTIVVASADDPYGSMDYARRCAAAWNAPLVNIGPKGHINAGSGLEDWPEGWSILQSFLENHRSL